MKLKEEQKQRELELQRRKMRTMDITKVSVGKLDDLIALPTASRTSGNPSKTRAHEHPGSNVTMQASSGPTSAITGAGGRGGVEKTTPRGGNSSPVQHVTSEKLAPSEGQSGKGENLEHVHCSKYSEKGAWLPICICYY